MDTKALLTIATAAKDDFVQVEEQNANYKQILEAQKVLINDYAVSMPDLEELEKKEAQQDEELEQVQKQLEQSQLILTELLQSNQPKQNSEQSEIILKNIMKAFTDRVMGLTKEAVANGQASTTIFKLIDLEGEISKLIEDLESKEMYPETQEENEERAKANNDHTVKLSQFLQLLKQILAQNKPAEN